jgi:hypothetical protein
MAVKPVSVETGPDLFDQLNAVRLSRDWSYRELAADIKEVTGFVVSAQTLQPLLSAPAEDRGKPYDRTLHKIRCYLTAIAEPAKPTRKAKRRAA